jgi:hypothetical protein
VSNIDYVQQSKVQYSLPLYTRISDSNHPVFDFYYPSSGKALLGICKEQVSFEISEGNEGSQTTYDDYEVESQECSKAYIVACMQDASFPVKDVQVQSNPHGRMQEIQNVLRRVRNWEMVLVE